MSRSVTLEIPETEALSLEAALDEALAALRHLEVETHGAREERIKNLRAETHVLMKRIQAELRHVEETV